MATTSSALAGPPVPLEEAPGDRAADPDGTLVQRRRIELHELALDKIGQGLCVFDGQQRLLLFNRRYARMYDIDPGRLWIGMTLRDVIDLRYAAGTGPDMTPEQYATWRCRIGVAERVMDTVVNLRNGHVHLIHHEPTPGGGWVATFEDITERRRSDARIRQMAHFDSLTGLANRALFMERLEQVIARLNGADGLERHLPDRDAGSDGLAAVLLCDLDRFKEVNDTLGHAAGDELLRQVAARIGAHARKRDLCARLGGDEFAIIMDGIARSDEADRLAERIVAQLAAPFLLDGGNAAIGASIGIAVCARGDDALDPAVVLRHADTALYRAKAAGRGIHRTFWPGMDAQLQRRRQMERDLRLALADGALEVHFQPLVALALDRIVGAEALARWHHPEHGQVSPAEFVPLAEQAGFIDELGACVLRTACARAARWGDISLAVNLSPEQVRRPGLVALLKEVLAETGLAPERLELEITEGVLLQETETTLATLGALRALGLRIVLDDFGTGYSSLGYLQRFPFSKLKIDRGFVAGLAGEQGAAAIVQAVVTLGHSLGMQVTAEGVETIEQRDRLRALGCDEAQGDLLGRPAPASIFEQMTRCRQERGT